MGFGVNPLQLPIAHAKSEWVGDESGALVGLDDEGKPTQAFPLKHTDVSIQVSGPLARAQVTQQFENPYSDKIEAVYTFPLPQNAAVDDMTLTVGDRVVKGTIKKREEARAIYEAAKRRGNVAGPVGSGTSQYFYAVCSEYSARRADIDHDQLCGDLVV